ncbi:MAG: hypothetical protein WAN51_07870 [Alphaproteobacteria bacterium]
MRMTMTISAMIFMGLVATQSMADDNHIAVVRAKTIEEAKTAATEVCAGKTGGAPELMNSEPDPQSQGMTVYYFRCKIKG